MEFFLSSFQEAFHAVAKIGLIVIAAGFLVRRGFIQDQQVKALSDLTIFVFLPCLIFSNITRNLDPAATPYWWAIPLAALAIAGFGFFLAMLLFLGEWRQKSNLLPVAVIQNAGYLVLPIGQVLIPEQFEAFSVYVFLFLLVQTPLIWTLGKFLISKNGGMDSPSFSWKGLLTPPLIANLLALTLLFSGTHLWIPELVSDSVQLLGQATVPLATFVVGASLGSIPILWKADKWDSFRIVLIKLVLIPAAMWLFLQQTGIAASQPLLALFLMLQASVAPATALILTIRTYGGDLHKVGTLFVLLYLFSTVTIPFWVAMLEWAR